MPVHDPSPVELTQALVRIDTVNPPGNEHRIGSLLADLLADTGWEAKVIETRPSRACVVAWLPSRDDPHDTALPLCFTGHLDVVPLGTAAWSHDPFGGEVEHGRLYGRGSSDMKSGVAAMICAARQVARLERRRSGVLVVLTAGEESGCDGARDLVQQGLLPRQVGALVVGEPTNLYPVIGHKGALWARITCHGTAAHGSTPELGKNAIEHMLPILQALPGICLGPTHALQGAPTINLGVVRGGSIPNQVPDRCEAELDIRTVAGCDHDEIVGRLQELVGSRGSVERLLDAKPVTTREDDRWVQRVFELGEAFIGERPHARAVTYFTDAAVLGPALGLPPTVICGPGDPALAHQTDEYAATAAIDKAALLYLEIARDWLV